MNENGHVNRRKSRLYSLSKSKPLNALGSSLSNSHFQLPHPGHLSGSSTGKYIPPYLRSPIYSRSPVVEPLTEELEHMTLNNDYDEVFHLEDDFELGGPHSKPEPDFKKPARSNTGTPESMFQDYATKPALSIPEITPGSGRRHSAISKRPLSIGTSLGLETLSSSANSTGGKYIPPFRRGSQPSNLYAKAKPERKGDDMINGKLVAYPLTELNNYAPNSVPSGGDWFSFKKDWSDYE